MIVLDTNVISEARKLHRDASVEEWVTRQRVNELYLTATVVGELSAGVMVLEPGRRRIHLQDDLDLIVGDDFAGRILPFDTEAALAYGHVLEIRRALGRPVELADAQIAAVCMVHDAALATRNTADFDGLGLTLIDPWQSE